MRIDGGKFRPYPVFSIVEFIRSVSGRFAWFLSYTVDNGGIPMRWNWLVSLFACLVLVLGLAVAAQAQDRKIVMRIGCVATPPQPQSLAA